MIWTDLGARARGLSSSLIAPAALAAVDRAVDRPTLVTALIAGGYAPVAVDDGRPEAVERAARDRTEHDLDALSRWSGDRADALAVVLEDEDRLSLRALLRGLVAGAPADRRLAGCVPTPRLPAALLDTLSRAASGTELVTALARRGLGEADVLRSIVGRAPIDLAAAERALAGRLAARAQRHQRAGGRALACFVTALVDSVNAEAALLLAGRGAGVDAAACFLPGGVRLSAERFAAATGATTAEARAILQRCFRGTPIAGAIERLHLHPGAVDDAALDWQLDTQRRLRRLEPHGPAPVLALLLARRVELRRVRHALWRLLLAPSPGGTP